MRRVLLAVAALVVFGAAGVAVAESPGNWREEFARICGRAGEGGKLSEAELSQLITDSDRLRAEIAASTDPDGKVYLFRLGKCRSFFLFMKESAAASPP